VEAGRKGEFVEKNQVRFVERFQWALAPALLCLLVSFWREFPVRPRPRELALFSGDRTRATGDRAVAATVAVALCLLSAVTCLPPPARAAEGSDALVAPLSQVVGRLAAQDNRAAADWAELGRTTLTYGQRLQSAQQPVPEGPVRDALSAVDAGAALDAKAADWPQLRKDLEALLQRSEEQKKQEQQQKQPQQDQSQQQNQSQQQKQDEKKQQDQQSQSQSDSGQKQEQSASQNQADRQKSESGQQPPKENSSAFGNMQDLSPPPPKPPQGETQKVGGTPGRRPEAEAEADPAMAAQLQKLDQLRDQDSPAKLFQIMEGDQKKTEPQNKGKNW
jgi:Ca-activated chloride channel family protein